MGRGIKKMLLRGKLYNAQLMQNNIAARKYCDELYEVLHREHQTARRTLDRLDIEEDGWGWRYKTHSTKVKSYILTLQAEMGELNELGVQIATDGWESHPDIQKTTREEL